MESKVISHFRISNKPIDVMYKGDTIYITRSDINNIARSESDTRNNTDNRKITKEEWIAYVESDSSMYWVEDLPPDKIYKSNGVQFPHKTVAFWFSNPNNLKPDLVFDLYPNGEFIFGFVIDADCLRKLLFVADKLGAFVQTDLGIILTESDALDLESDGYDVY